MPEALKNIFFTEEFVNSLAAAIQEIYPPFDAEAFRARALDNGWEARELKARMRHITGTLSPLLPVDYRAALDILRQVARTLEAQAFDKMVFSDFAALYGTDDWDASIPALEEFTQQISAEFAVRYFILKDPDRMMTQMLTWAGHPNPHVRRLASEGCRPRLPWAIRVPALIKDPSPILPILDALKLDPEEWVRRSVANNLNDIAKDHPDVVVEVLSGWQQHDTPEIKAITAHALRTLVKKGHPGALALLGFSAEAEVTVKNLVVEPDTIPLHGDITFSFEVESLGETPQDLVIDYVVHLMRANGKQTPKVFKLSKRTIQPGETITLRRKHSFAPVTTRKYYPGEHALEVQINGAVLDRAEFQVTE